MLAVILYPKESFITKQVIDEDEFIVHNSKGLTFEVGGNKQFEGDTMQDASKQFNVAISDSPNMTPCQMYDDVEVPEKYNYRWDPERNQCVDQPRMSGNCTASHVLSVLSTVEDRICIANGGDRFRLSAQDVISCDPANYQCNGGYVTYTLNYGQSQGYIREECSPWTMTNTTCPEEPNE